MNYTLKQTLVLLRNRLNCGTGSQMSINNKAIRAFGYSEQYPGIVRVNITTGDNLHSEFSFHTADDIDQVAELVRAFCEQGKWPASDLFFHEWPYPDYRWTNKAAKAAGMVL